jgi:hypothetical protein
MSNFTPFSPLIPTSKSFSTREDIIDHIISRMVRGIFNDGKGYSVDLTIVRSEVEGFARRNLRDKSFHQLRLIEAIPSLTVTPDLMKECGFIRDEAKGETSVIYIKTVVGKKDSLDRMMGQGHEGSRRYARKLKSFLSDTNRPKHLLDLPPQHLIRDPSRPTFYHIGRYINGVQTRRRGENVSQFDPLAGDRPWSSALFNSHGDHDLIQYWPLEDHSGLVGEEWYRRMVSPNLLNIDRLLMVVLG